MQKELFTKENLDPYRNDPLIKTALNGMALLNCDEFLSWYNFSREARSPKSDRELVEQLQNDLLEGMPEDACNRKIGVNYGIDSIISIIRPHYDVIFALAPNYDTLKREEFSAKKIKTAISWKINHILGFIIVEKGECKKLPNTYSVKLICARYNLKYKLFSKRKAVERERVRAALLMGGYLYCAKKLYSKKLGAILHAMPGSSLPESMIRAPPGLPIPHVVDQTMGILELANGYLNINGFFSYSKMGFKKNFELFEGRCFKAYGNLPMSVNLNSMTYDRIIGLASGVEKITDFGDDNDFMQLLPKTERQLNLQKEIARCYNLLYQMKYVLTKGHSIRGAELEIIEGVEKKYYDYYEKNEPGVYIPPITYDDYLDYLYGRLDAIFAEYYRKTPSKTMRIVRSLSIYRKTPSLRATVKRARTK
jgi:hypothetical protein